MMVELIATWSGANLHPAQTHSCSLAWSSSWMASKADLTVARKHKPYFYNQCWVFMCMSVLRQFIYMELLMSVYFLSCLSYNCQWEYLEKGKWLNK